MTEPSAPQRLELKDLGDVTVATFTDRYLLEQKQVQAISDQLFSVVDERGRRKLVLNFGNIQDVSSLALGMLVTLNKKMQAAGGKLVLCRVDPQIRELMALTQLDTLFIIRGDEQEATKAF